ncbi:MAG: glycosyltransferase 87 family protein [Thermoplasmata archaeon]|nr:glycosyltransferase 87 family protein [Thermoplasmata archaeon]
MVLLVGTGLRLLLAPLTSQYDPAIFGESSATMALGGGPYTYLIVYPTDWVLVLNLIGRTAALFLPANALVAAPTAVLTLGLTLGGLEPTSYPVPLVALLEKGFVLLFDLAMAGLLYAIVQEWTGDRLKARLVFAAWFLNPFVIIESGVHGAFDVIPTFFVIASFYLWYHDRPLSAGAAFGLGVMVKVYPLLLLPLFGAALLARRDLAPLRRAMSVLWFGLGTAGIVALSLWPPGIFQQYLQIVGTGPSVGESHGGFGPWSLSAFPGLGGWRRWLFLNTAPVALISTVIAFGLVTLFAVYYARRAPAGSWHAPLTYAAIGSVFAILLSFSVAQPQYLLWILPWLLLAAIVERRFRTVAAAVTLGGSAFYVIGLAGPLYLVQPTAIFTHWISFSLIDAAVLGSPTYGPWVELVTTVSVFLLLVYAALQALRRLRRPTAGGVVVAA